MPGAAALLVLLFAGYVAVPVPAPATRLTPGGTAVLAADGTILQRDARDGVRIPVALGAVAPVMIEATVAAEDERFWRHPGIDPLAMVRALVQLPGGRRSGASTLTQQLARRLYIGDGGPIALRKAHEILFAVRLEAHTGKEELLEAYLNDVYYGRGAYGVEAAARVFFGVGARDLDLARAAFLAALPRAPDAFDPLADPGAARARQAYVLGQLVADGKITESEAAEAAAAPLAFAPAAAALAPHFVAYVLDELAAIDPALARAHGLVIETTLDAGLQQEAERLVAHHLAALAGRGASNAAVVVIDPRDGSVLAMVGSAGFANAAIDGQVNVALAKRQPGSALKPFVYAAALERGYTAATPLLDIPSTFPSASGVYSPANYNRRFHGVVPLRVALASSFNVPAVRVIDDIGVDTFLELAQRVGLSTLTEADRYGVALALGSGEVRLIDLTSAYGALANGGQRVAPASIQRVRDARGRVVYERPVPKPVPVLSPETAWLISDILRDPEARLPGFGEQSPLDNAVGAAVKTGTTTDSRDNWAIGYTPARAVGVWVGNSDGSPMAAVSGVDGAGPIWRDVIEAAVGRAPVRWPPPPSGLVRVVVCAPAGLLPGPACPSPAPEWFVRGTEPQTVETYYARTANGQLLVDPPPEARPWAANAGLQLVLAPAAGAGVRVVAPVDGAVLVLSPALPVQELLIRAVGPGAVELEVRVDGELATLAAGDSATVRWPLDPGRHTVDVTAVLATGERIHAQSRYEVRR